MELQHALTVESLTEEGLSATGLREPGRAMRILRALPGQGVPDDLIDQLLPSLLDALRRSPDPDRALNNFERWTNAVTSRYTHFQLLLRHPAALDIFSNVCGTSQFFSDILVHNPEYVEILANPSVRRGGRSAGAVYRDLSGFVDHIAHPELKLEAMRRFKQREILRIGVADILGLVDMPGTAREFSNLADACVQKAYEIAVTQLTERFPELEPPHFAVIAMGKLGGQELNYSSDIDLIFVTEDLPAELAATESQIRNPKSEIRDHGLAHKLAESITSALSSNLQNGHLFRVDLRLRPEGRFGALVRTLSSYRAYYESWAEPWEMQALLKARFIAGDSRTGAAFIEMIAPYVYRRTVSAAFIDDIRRNKTRIEQKAEIEGQSRTNVKIGIGGIRDIEFIVQLLQLRFGGRHPILKTPNTLEALGRLRQHGFLTQQEAAELSEDYAFLRNVEHRLQILYDLQTQALPASRDERNLLGRRLTYEDAAAFDEDYARRTGRVHEHYLRLFRGTDIDHLQSASDWEALAGNVTTAKARLQIEQRLQSAGFRDPARITTAMQAAVTGTAYGIARPESRKSFLKLAGRLMASASRTGDPDAAYLAVDGLALDSPNRAEFYHALLEGEELLDRLCVLGAGSPPMIQTLARHPEWLDLLVSDEIVDPAPKTREVMSDELAVRLATAKPGLGTRHQRRTLTESFWNSLATYVQRERLRTAARDLWGEIGALSVARELTNLAGAALQTLLSVTIETTATRFTGADTRAALESVAIIGLGKLGAAELGYQSDWDILLVFRNPNEPTAEDEHEDEDDSERPNDPSTHLAVNALAESLLSATQELRTRGADIEIDPRLRPDGRFGSLARTVADHCAYYRDSALVWERQMLTRARPIAGNMETASRFMRAIYQVVYNEPLGAEAQLEIQEMKRRIESERLKPDATWTDLKLGYGGMSDIEFTVQLYQLREGAVIPIVRSANTVEVLHALGAAAVIPAPDAARLANSYAHLMAVRNWIALRGITGDALPDDSARLRPIAIGLGFADSDGEAAEALFRRRLDEGMRETRQIVDRLFYEASAPLGA